MTEGSRAGRWLAELRRRRPRLIFDTSPRFGDFSQTEVAYDTTLCNEEVARELLFSHPGDGLRFLDVGARDGRLHYLLGVEANLRPDPELYARNLERFQAKYHY